MHVENVPDGDRRSTGSEAGSHPVLSDIRISDLPELPSFGIGAHPAPQKVGDLGFRQWVPFKRR